MFLVEITELIEMQIVKIILKKGEKLTRLVCLTQQEIHSV